MQTNDLKKGDIVYVTNLPKTVKGEIYDNKKGNIRMIKVFGSHIGLFDEIGSVYSHDISHFIDKEGLIVKIEHTKEQIKLKETIKAFC